MFLRTLLPKQTNPCQDSARCVCVHMPFQDAAFRNKHQQSWSRSLPTISRITTWVPGRTSTGSLDYKNTERKVPQISLQIQG